MVEAVALTDEVLAHPRWALGEDDVLVLIRLNHASHHLVPLLIRERLMEQVAHGAHEDAARLAPVQRIVESVRVEGRGEADRAGAVATRAPKGRKWAAVSGEPRAAAVGAPRSCKVPTGDSLRVAVVARLRDGRAASHRVPCGIGPLDTGVVTHSGPPKSAHSSSSSSPTRITGGVGLRVAIMPTPPFRAARRLDDDGAVVAGTPPLRRHDCGTHAQCAASVVVAASGRTCSPPCHARR